MAQGVRLPRRAALLLPLAAAGCATLDEWFGDKKTPLTGARVGVTPPPRGLAVDNPASRPVTLPQAAPNDAWPQSGGEPAHAPEHLAIGAQLQQAWTASIGTGGAYWRKLTATPVIGGGRVFTMDIDALVSAYDLRTGHRIWRTKTVLPKTRSANIGGGISLDGDTLYAATGLADVFALDAATGKVRWHQALAAPARAAPTIVQGRLFLPTLDQKVQAHAAKDGSTEWSFQGTDAQTLVLGMPSPAYADGLVVAGFGSGDLACLRAESGTVSWSDALTAPHGGASLLDFAAIVGLPVIAEGQVYAAGLGGLLVALDLRSGRRLWEREVASEQTPWVAGDWLFVLTPDQHLGAINRTDGTVAWATQLPQFQNPKKKDGTINWMGPVLAGGRLFVVGSGREVLTVNPITGVVLHHQKLPGRAALPPVVADRTLFVVTEDATLVALR
jgi:outer membrane protein assembly factor BamB